MVVGSVVVGGVVVAAVVTVVAVAAVVTVVVVVAVVAYPRYYVIRGLVWTLIIKLPAVGCWWCCCGCCCDCCCGCCCIPQVLRHQGIGLDAHNYTSCRWLLVVLLWLLL